MSGSIIPTPDYKAVDGQSFGTQVEKQRLGFIGLSLTNYDNNSVPQIAAGSCVEISGSIFQFPSNDTITGTPSSGNINYIILTVSGSGDSQTVGASWTTTVPSWNTSKQGWYDATNAKRYVAECYYEDLNYTGKLDYGGSYKTKADGIPEGIIVAQIPGYFGNGSNGSYTAVSIPLKSKWKRCDGSVLNDPLSVIFNGAGRYLPNLTDDRFLMGDTFATIGGIGGSNTFSAHKHQVADISAGGTYNWRYRMYNSAGTAVELFQHSYDTPDNQDGIYPTGQYPATQTFYSKTDGGGGENRPKYLSCQYLMKVRA